jgi:hypothetical protein
VHGGSERLVNVGGSGFDGPRIMKSQSPIALVAAMVLGVCVIIGVATERRITDVNQLAGTWHGRATGQLGSQARILMTIREDGSYESSTTTEEGSVTVGNSW